MSHYLSEITFELEKHMINPDKWKEHLPKLPKEAREILEAELKRPSGPTGLAWHPKYKYVILGSGQGPFIIWSDHEELRGK